MINIINPYRSFQFSVVMPVFVLVISLIIISSMFFTIYAFADVKESSVLRADKTMYHWGDAIVITGIIKNSSSEKYVIQIFDPVNTSPITSTPFVPKTDGSFSQIFFGIGPLWGMSGNYMVVLQSGSERLSETKFLFIAYPRYGITATESKGNITDILPPPMMQLRSGIKAQDVRCMDGFVLILKSKDRSPACVKPNTAQILFERGWAKNS